MELLIRKISLYIVTVMFPLILAAQPDAYFRPERHDVGAFGGVAFYYGDLTDNHTILSDPSSCIGPLYRYNLTAFYSLRGQISFGQLHGNMHRTDMPEQHGTERWEFKRPLVLVEMGTEINFLPLNVTDFRKKQRWSPYLLLGLGFVGLAPDREIFIEDSNMQTFGIYLLMGLGVKIAIVERFTLGLEWAMRKTNTDDIDYYAGQPGSWLLNRDWVGTLGITLTYRLPEDRTCAAYRQHRPATYPLKGKLLK
jgi:hypothetical protein